MDWHPCVGFKHSFSFLPLSHFTPILFHHSPPNPPVTSGIPFFLFLVLLPYSIPWMEVDSTWICVVHYLACLSPTVGSVIYHVFMNHVGGEHVYDTLLSLDMFGVCLVNTLGRLLVLIWLWYLLPEFLDFLECNTLNPNLQQSDLFTSLTNQA